MRHARDAEGGCEAVYDRLIASLSGCENGSGG